MDELTLKTFCLGSLSNNCYLVFNQKTKKGFIIDSPTPFTEVTDFVKSEGLDILFVLLTHAHFDHIAGLDSHRFPFYVHNDDAAFLKNPQLNGSGFFGSLVVISKEPKLYQNSASISFEDQIIDVIHTPGHTPGSVSLKLSNWLFSGDALFFDSIGRTDIPLACESTLVKAIKENILPLPKDTIVYPGHGFSTTVKREKDFNPFLK